MSTPTPPPPRPLKQRIEEAVVADLKSGKYGRNEIAERHNIGRATVTRIAHDNDLDPSAKANQTQHATRAVAIETRARREKLKSELLDDIQALRVRAWSAWSKEVPGRDGETYTLTAELPPLPEVASAYRAVGPVRYNLRAARDEFEQRTGLALDSREATQLIRGEVIDNQPASEG